MTLIPCSRSGATMLQRSMASLLTLCLAWAAGNPASLAQGNEPAANAGSGDASGAAAGSATATTTAGAKGAQVYCYMRGAGNSHDVSWTAAYALIKRQSASLFKTSPEHAAVMITEAVVQNPGSYPDCGQYLGSLFEKAAPREAAPTSAGAAPASTTPRTGY